MNQWVQYEKDALGFAADIGWIFCSRARAGYIFVEFSQ